jgi:hypothetical protein
VSLPYSWRNVPNLDIEVQTWVYTKAEPFIQNRYRGLTKVVFITRRKDWKRPSDWGELDMDVFFVRIPADTPPDNVQDAVENAEEFRVKLVAKFDMLSGFETVDYDKLGIKAGLIDWLDGKSITLRTWLGIVTRRPDGRCEIGDVPEPPPPPLPHRRFTPSNRPQYA